MYSQVDWQGYEKGERLTAVFSRPRSNQHLSNQTCLAGRLQGWLDGLATCRCLLTPQRLIKGREMSASRFDCQTVHQSREEVRMPFQDDSDCDLTLIGFGGVSTLIFPKQKSRRFPVSGFCDSHCAVQGIIHCLNNRFRPSNL